MPKRLCRRCGKEYEGSHGSSLCPVCVKAQRHTGNIKQRTCRTCGVEFPGGPRAYYCPDCRKERQKEASRRFNARKAAGKTRAIGSTDLCAVCEKPYIVASGLQQFCEDCQLQRKREDALARYHADPDAAQKKRERRSDGNPDAECLICGKTYKQSGHWLTCSRECSRIHAENLKSQWIKENPGRRSELNKNWYRRFFESMSAEELAVYRSDKAAAARMRYHKSKED